MPVRLFTDADRERLNRFPRDVPPGDLLASFTLSDADLELIGDRRGDHNRLGYALQLKALPYLGFVPDYLTSAPSRVVAYLALQLSVPTEALSEYGDREHTRTDHLREIQNHLGFRDTTPADSAVLGSWLLDRALEHDKPMVLFHLACQWLLQEHLVRPGVTIIERLVATTRERAQDETYRRLTSLLTPALRDRLDAVLRPHAGTGRTPLSWLQLEATALTPRAILGEIAKLTYLRGLGADAWELTKLTPNRRKLPARIGRRATNQALQRTPPERRYPILLAFLEQAVEEVTDEVVDLFDRALFFGNEGEIRRSQHEDQTTHVLCLNLAANAIIAWKTVYMAEALDVLRSDGFAVDDDDLVHVPPTLCVAREHLRKVRVRC